MLEGASKRVTKALLISLIPLPLDDITALFVRRLKAACWNYRRLSHRIGHYDFLELVAA
jgi:hypothetical protein